MRESERERLELTEDDRPQIEKNDMLALWLSGMKVIALPCILMILLIVGVTLLLFGR